MDQALFRIYAGFSFALGAVVASFLNVVIWRVPRGESIVSPPSHCPKCNAAIRWYQNVPILSWLALRGKCAKCRAPISPRYIFVEALGGILFLSAFCAITPSSPLGVAHLAVMWIWLSLLIVGSAIDFDLQLLPDFVTVGGMALGVVWAAVESGVAYFSPSASSLHLSRLFDCPIVHSLLGLVFGFGLLWLVRFFGTKAFRREAMGMGDVFLMGAVGALFGPVAVLFTLIVSSVLGSVAGAGLMLFAKLRFGRFVAIPYGPYIAAANVVWIFWGPRLVTWYLQLLSGR